MLLPGMAYTCDMPLFYYAENCLTERGADLLRVEYAYNRRPDFYNLATAEQARWLFVDATVALQVGLAQREYDVLTLVGKSLGTLAMGHLLTNQLKPVEVLNEIWLTPLVGDASLREQIRRFDGRALVVIGTADAEYDPVVVDEVRQAAEGEVVVVAGADHGFDVPGDVTAAVRAVEAVVTVLERCLA